MCLTLLSTPFPNTAFLFDLSSFPSNPAFHPLRHQSSDTPGSHSHLKISLSIQSVFYLSSSNLSISPITVVSISGNSCSDSQLWSWSGPLSPCPLTLHIYADGLDGSHPHPVVGLAVVATPLHPLDALNAQRLVVDGCFLELVWCTACGLRPPYLKRAEKVRKCWLLSLKACMQNRAPPIWNFWGRCQYQY